MKKYEFLEIEIIRVDDVLTASPGGSIDGDNQGPNLDDMFDGIDQNGLLS